MAKAKSIKGRINGSTNAYLGNTRMRDTNARGNKFGTHRKNWQNMRIALGLSPT